MTDFMDSLDELLERSQIDQLSSIARSQVDELLSRRSNDGNTKGGKMSKENSMYDSEDGDVSQDVRNREWIAMFGDEDDEGNNDDGIEGDDTGTTTHADYLRTQREETEAHINAQATTTWAALAKRMVANNKRSRVTESEEEAEENGISLDESSDDQKRASNLRVRNAAGKDMGAYVPKQGLTLEEAYNRINPIPKPPAALTRQRDHPPQNRTHDRDNNTSSPMRNPSYESRDDEAEAEALFNDVGITMTPEIREKLQILSGKKRGRDDPDYDDTESIRPGATNLSHKHARVDPDITSPESDLDYMRLHFADMLNDSNITAEQMRDTFCPLCGFGNLANEEAVIAGVYNQTNDMARHGAQGDHSTMALIISEFWNSNLYRPMRKKNKRIMPLTYNMAYNHMHKPHRLEAANDHQKDIRRAIMKQDILDNMIFSEDTLTGRILYDPKAFSMSMACTRSKNILRKTQPEKMAFYSAPNDKLVTELASHNVNPFRNVQFGYRQAPSAPGVRQSSTGKTGSTSLGGRRK